MILYMTPDYWSVPGSGLESDLSKLWEFMFHDQAKINMNKLKWCVDHAIDIMLVATALYMNWKLNERLKCGVVFFSFQGI